MNPLNPELIVIGCCISGGLDTTMEAVSAVQPAAFDRDDCRDSFEVIEQMATQGVHIDEFSFRHAWTVKFGKRPVPPEIIEAADNSLGNHSMGIFVEEINDNHERRRVETAAQVLQSKAKDKTVSTDALIAEAEAILQGHEIRGAQTMTGRECAKALLADLEHRHENHVAGIRSGIRTGFGKLDFLTDGLQPGEQTIIAARPSAGKTAIALNVVTQACLRDKIPTLVISMEMRPQALMRRMLSDWHNIEMGALKSGNFTEGQMEKFLLFSNHVSKCPLFIENGVSGLDINRIAAIVRRMHRKHGIKLVVTDYLQKIKPGSKQEKKTYEIGEISGILKALAESTNTAFLTLAQLNRESEKDKGRIPRLADLADSAQIERDADTVALIHRPRTEQDPQGQNASLIIAKQRDGELGVVDLTFEGQFCRFKNPMI